MSLSRFLRCVLSGFVLASWTIFASAQSATANRITVEVDPTTYQKSTIYASYPQECGDGTKNCRLTEWVGTWYMPDGTLMVAFNQATGPTSPVLGRTFTPEPLLNLFTLSDGRIWTHIYPGGPGRWFWDTGYDFFGLSGDCPPSPTLPTTQKCSLIVYIKSTDSGKTWKPWRTEPFQAIGMSAHSPQPTIALPNGTLIRRVNGDDLQNIKDIPHTAMLQTLKSKNGNYPGEWPRLGENDQVVVKDPLVCKYQVSRIRRLNDGRYIALGQAWRYANGETQGRCGGLDTATNLLLIAESANAAEKGEWKRGMPDIPSSLLVANEWDVAPLPNGDLFALFRTLLTPHGPIKQIRKQAILRKSPTSKCPDKTSSGCWVIDETTLGNPGNLPHSGHPDLLATREGVVIQFATTGNSYTNDGGTTWIPLAGTSRSDYYPRSIQDPVSRDIYLFGHVGGDDPYGGKSPQNGGNYSGINQSITMQKFRLKVRVGSER